MLLWLKLIRMGRYLLIPLYLIFTFLTYIHFKDTGIFDLANFTFWTMYLAATFMLVKVGEHWLMKKVKQKN